MVTVNGLAKAARNVLLAPWRVALWTWSVLMRLLLYVSLLATAFGIVTFGHGLWHMSRPLDNPHFRGLTYWQVLEWETMITDRQATAWNRAHPSAERKASWKFCVVPDFIVFGLTAYTMAARNHLPVLVHEGPRPYLQAVDTTWEEWATKALGPDLTTYCSTPTVLPTPEELDRMRAEYVAWKKTQASAQSP